MGASTNNKHYKYSENNSRGAGRKSGTGSDYFLQGYFINAVRLKMLIASEKNRAVTEIANENGINYVSISNKFEMIKSGEHKTSKVVSINLKKFKKANGNWQEVSSQLIELVKQAILEGKDNQFIRENLKLEGEIFNMENNVVVKNEVITNIAIDLGNFSIKCLGERETIITSKVKTVYDNVCDNEYIKFEDSETYDLVGCEDGKYQLDPQKTKKNYISQVIYSIINSYNEAPDDIQCNVALLLPITQMSDKDEYIEKLKDYECIVEVTGGKVYTVKINEVVVLPESVASYFALSNEEKENKLAICDIGSKNVNICSYLHGKLQKVECLEYGTFKYLEALAKKYNASGNIDITAHNITTQIECELAEHDETLITNFAKTVMADIITKMDAFRLYNNVLFTGGGSKMIEDFIDIIPNAIKKKDVVMSNTIGAKNMMDEIYSV